MNEIKFYKYQGTGNDFIIIDNRDLSINLNTQQVKLLCDRRFGIGADGLMYLQLKDGYDFEMIYFNADGNESSMCGNGGRCLVQFAYHQHIKKESYKFLAVDGEHEAFFGDSGWVHLKMNNVNKIIVNENGDSILNTGSPHYIKQVDDIKSVNVFAEGKAIRYNDTYKTKGINVNFVQPEDEYISVRTYERGVEDETLSCGTGVTAAALVNAHNDFGFNRVKVQTPGGNLAVEFYKKDANNFENIWLCGPATFVFSGNINI